jgi:hypothetical protein
MQAWLCGCVAACVVRACVRVRVYACVRVCVCAACLRMGACVLACVAKCLRGGAVCLRAWVLAVGGCLP